MLKRFLGILAIGLVVAAAPAHAQWSNTRNGFWLGFGLGGGSVGTTCYTCNSGTTDGTSGYIRMGGTVSRSFLVGGELAFWNRPPSSGLNESVEFYSLVGVWYPNPRGAFFLKFGLGGMAYTDDDGNNRITANAPAASFGLGYDFRVGRTVALTPYLNTYATSGVSFQYNGAPVAPGENITLNLVQLGLALHWY